MKILSTGGQRGMEVEHTRGLSTLVPWTLSPFGLFYPIYSNTRLFWNLRAQFIRPVACAHISPAVEGAGLFDGAPNLHKFALEFIKDPVEACVEGSPTKSVAIFQCQLTTGPTSRPLTRALR
jgi:hypothetical protein